jgi:hypothetical protein
MATVARWQVATFQGREYLVLGVNEYGFASLSTGPSLWGSGMIVGAPVAHLMNVRDLKVDDEWRCSGSFDRWTAADLARSLCAAGGRTNSELGLELDGIVRKLGTKRWVRPTTPGWWCQVQP